MYNNVDDQSSFLFKKLINNIVISKLIFNHVYSIHRGSPTTFINPTKGTYINNDSLVTMLKFGRNDLFFENTHLLLEYFNRNNSNSNNNNKQYQPISTLKEAMLTGNLRVVNYLMDNIKSLSDFGEQPMALKDILTIIKQGYTEIFDIVLSLRIDFEHIGSILFTIINSHRYLMLANFIKYLMIHHPVVRDSINPELSDSEDDNQDHFYLDSNSEESEIYESIGNLDFNGNTGGESLGNGKILNIKINEALESDSERTYDLLLRYHKRINLAKHFKLGESYHDVWQVITLKAMDAGEYKAAEMLFKRRKICFHESMFEYDNQFLQLVLKYYQREEIIVDDVISLAISRGDIHSFRTILNYTELTEGKIQQALIYQSSIDIINYIIDHVKPTTTSLEADGKWILDDLYHQYCSIDILKRLLNNRYFECRFRFLLATAIEHRLDDVIEYIMENQQLFQIDYVAAISAAITHGYLKILSILIKQSPNLEIEVPDPYSSDRSSNCRQGNTSKIDGNAYIAALQMVLDSSIRVQVSINDICYFFARRLSWYPFLEQVVRMLHQRGVIEHNDSVVDISTFPVSKSLLELLEEMPINYADYSIYNCATSGSLELFRYLIERHQQLCPPSALKAACERGFTDIVKYIVERNLVDDQYVIDALRRAIECGYLDQVTYMLEHKFTADYFRTTLMKPKFIRQSLKYPDILEYLLPSSDLDLRYLLRFLMTEDSDAHRDAFNIVLKQYLKNHPTTQPFIASTPKQLVKNNQYKEIQSIFDLNLVHNTHRDTILNEIYNLSISYGQINIIKICNKLIINNNNNK
ncbi:hypothetical protein PPL_08878 [Heterostelium album PN500]|uniref:Ankyrin repeat-containing protein n=1 Tax=Heterostelium pallidum (strain ATCC 26659 / Pp 5 / PN500) TaxID=670386 RepID=D3BJZ7_HETP5|nr:hypothetical protein PPL_08878 [Heterostelium album PN500]EFA78227.1 hypothetical protein PPL_08878 [Heterostelium album PN500]|eukprot:XP_020430352.1 hypothetical protein PPL_08878 [Heterostelium album PN500]